jgi:hypothetical protein
MSDKSTLQDSEGVVERDALLFRAGEYPDKDIEITEDDLDTMVANFAPAPIKVEHTDSPLRFGLVTRIWRAGSELFGRLAFNPLAWALARECGATKLSVAVRRDKSGIEEVSLVRSPRVAGAAVFSTDASCFTGEDLDADAPIPVVPTFLSGGSDRNVRPTGSMDEGGDSLETQLQLDGTGGEQAQPAAFSSADDRVAALANEIKARDVDAKIDTLKRQGKLTPAAETFARSLLMAEDEQSVTFADPDTGTEKREAVAKTFEAFLEAQPKVIEFSELVPAGGERGPEFSTDDERLFSKLGVSPEAVKRNAVR